ncbi:MAG: dienelactone hydrolase [Patiriisocius sp.]|jgi:dienelactone hydrolase
MLRYLIILIILSFNHQVIGQIDEFAGEKISFFSLDSLEITADLYVIENKRAPYIILYHQANSSRGEYRNIAPKLNDLGFNCIAIDQRSGHKSQGITNETCKRAIKANKKIRFTSAIPDTEATLQYVKNILKAEEIIIWGSSYSASVVFYLGSKYPRDVDAIIAFSPGEYLKINDKSIASFSPDINCPIFIASGKKEQKKWDDIYNGITVQKSFFIPKVGGAHGSKALWPDTKGNESYWNAINIFLGSI